MKLYYKQEDGTLKTTYRCIESAYYVTATTSQFSLKRAHSETTKDGTTCGHERDSIQSKKQHHDRTSVVTSKSGNESHVTDYLLEQRIRREIQERTEVKNKIICVYSSSFMNH
jgi:hypothetical protein